jgi:hypothetical protein
MMQPQPNTSGYSGQISVIPLGRAGLFTDAAQSDIPVSGLIRANNVTYYNQIIQKDYGSRIWNSTPLPSSIIRAQEMYPDSQSQDQRIFCLCANGQIYKFTNNLTQVQITANSSTDPVSLNTNNYTSMVVGGNELVNQPKKLFTFDGYDSPQVISGDGTTRHSIALPAFDWSGTNQPFGGIIFGGSLWAFGNRNNPHAIYSSNALNHEDFQTVDATNTYSVFPGEYDGIVCAAVFRGQLYILKYPLGLYYLVQPDTNPIDWYFAKQSDDFGACSPQSAAVCNNDLIIANNYGSFTSLLAALIFGDTVASDLFHTQQCFRFAENEVRPDLVKNRSIVYYSKKQQLLGSFQSNQGIENDRISVIDFKNPQKVPKIGWTNKDQPNCLFLVRNNLKIPKPFYGSSDGNIYEMDVPDYWVGSETNTANQSGYLFDIQTPYSNFSQDNMLLGSQVKTYEFLEVEYEPTGDFECNVDIFIDQRFQGTYQFNLSGRSNLSEMPLNSSRIDGLGGFYRRFPIYGEGRTISLRFYNSVLGQGVRLVRASIYYRLSGQQQTTG